MDRSPDKGRPDSLPPCAVEYIAQVVAAVRYRKAVRQDIRAELTAHFEDALRDADSELQRERRAKELIEAFGEPKLLATLCRRAKKRGRPLWQKILIRGTVGLGLFFLYVAICSVPLFLGKPTIDVNYMQWLSDHWRPETAEIQNAKTYYDRAAELYVKPPEGLEARMRRRDWSAYDCNQADMNLLRAWLKQNGPAFQMMRDGAATARYWPVYDPNLSNTTDPNLMADIMNGALPAYRRIALAMRREIGYSARIGEVGKALGDSFVLLRFGRRLQAKGLLVEQMVGIALEALGLGTALDVLQRVDVPETVLQDFLDRMQATYDPDRRVLDFTGEKALWYDRIQRTFTDDGAGGGHALPRGIPFAAGDWGENLLGILAFDYPSRRETVDVVDAYFERVSEMMETPPGKEPSGSMQIDLRETARESLMLSITLPAYDRINQLIWRLKTQEAATLTVTAILQYEHRQGHYPAQLADLVDADLLTTLPLDPYGPGPLSYERTSKGFVLYGWGRNRTDDGGRQGTGSDGRPRLWQDNGDWVFWPVEDVSEERAK